MANIWNNDNSRNIPVLANKILNEIIKLDNNGLQVSFETLVSSVPSILYGKVKEDIREANYHIWFLSWFMLMGFSMETEILISKGRIDAVLKKDDLLVIIEIKHDLAKSLDKLVDEAIGQIKNKEYYSPYIGLNYNIVLLGVAFGDRTVKCHVESLNI